MSTAETIERARRWATPVAILTILAVVMFAVHVVILSQAFSADGDADLLREIDQDAGAFLVAYGIRAIGAALLVFPLVYLFRAAEARSDRVRSQLIGLMIAAPLFLAAYTVFDGLSIKEAAPDFVTQASNAGLQSGERADELANDVIEDQSLRGFAAGFGFAGVFGFAFALAYTCFHAMQVGLLTRFWGSLGAALGIATIFLPYGPVLWMIYLGLLIGGWTPRGRPPAWAAGEAIPWPTPGEQAAESLEGEDEPDRDDEPRTAPEPASADEGEEAVTPPSTPRRKRKRRD